MTGDAVRNLEQHLDEDLVDAARAMVQRSLVVGSVGNVSVRWGSGLRITPTRLSHRELEAADLVTVDGDGRVSAGSRTPSREWPMHAAIYGARQDVGAIVHTHSPQAAAWSCVAQELRGHTEDFAYYAIDTVRVTEAVSAGSRQLANAAVRALGRDGRALLIREHGVVAVGETVDDALVIAEVVEHQATIAWLLRGTGRHLPQGRS